MRRGSVKEGNIFRKYNLSSIARTFFKAACGFEEGGPLYGG
jgi:hypothetical protein